MTKKDLKNTRQFKEALKPDVTYSISFGEAIKDLHEGNLFKDYSFVFVRFPLI